MLKRFAKSLLLSLLAFLIISDTALAAWVYLFPVTVRDTSNTTRTYYPVMLGFGGQSLVNASKISVNGTNTNMQIGSTDIRYMMSTTNVTAVIPNLPSGGIAIADFYTGYSPIQTGFPIITGDGGYVTVADSPNLESANNFTIRFEGWIDTSLVSRHVPMIQEEEDLNLWLSSDPGDYQALGEQISNYPIATPTQVSFMLLKSGLPTGTANITLRNSSNATIGVLGTIDVSTLTVAGVWYSFNNTAVSNPTVQTVKFTIEYSGGDVANRVGARVRNADVFSNGEFTRLLAGVWANNAAVDTTFRIYSGSSFLLNKNNAFNVRANSGNITAQILGTSANVTSENVSVGEHTVVVRADATLFEIMADENALWNSDFEIGDPPTSWVVSGAGATANRSATQAHSNTYSANVTTGAATSLFTQSVSNYADFLGENVTLGGWVYATVANRVRLRITDDAADSESANHSGVAGWEWLTVTHLIDPATTTLRVRMVTTGGVATMDYLDGIKLVEGNTISQTPPIPTTVALGGASIPNNTNNWTFAFGNSMPYADNITLSVSGTQQLYFAPLIMLTGTTVPDRSGDATSNPGTITWGSNSGISIIYGEMESYAGTELTPAAAGGFSMPQSPMPSTWFAAGENVANLPFYDSFNEVANQIGVPVQVFYFWFIMGVAFGVFIGIVTMTRSALLAYVAMVIVFAIGSSMTIIPAWIVFAMIVTGGGIMFLYRQVSY